MENTNFEGTTAGFCAKVLELLPRDISHERMKELETSGKLRDFLKILSDEKKEQFWKILQSVNDGAYEISPRYELRDGVPYLNGKEIILVTSKKQDYETIRGYDLFQLFMKIPGGTHISSSMIDFWEANPDQFPERFKKTNKNGERLKVFCWGDRLDESIPATIPVRSASWLNGDCVYSGRSYIDQNQKWNSMMPAAVLKS